MIKIIAHRGASKEAPENTLAAIKQALLVGVDYIECDVHFSKEGVPVLIHDDLLGRTVKGREGQSISHLTLEQIQALDAGSWFSPSFSKERVPTLREVLQIERGSQGLMIEVKKGHYPIKSSVRSMVEILQEFIGYQEGPILVGSFSSEILKEFHSLLPSLPLIGIVENLNNLASFEPLNLRHYAFWYPLLNPVLVDALHQKRAQVWAFTVDDIRVTKFLQSIYIDGIITNDPSTLKQLLFRVL
jgi:glycerophosphoryl diester phosphodiesterase